MRELQRRYYEGEKHLLSEAKKVERMVDRALKEWGRPSLFDAGGGRTTGTTDTGVTSGA
jgi:hypothetical protein